MEDNGIKVAYCRGNVMQRNKAIKSFYAQTDVRVIMLSIDNSASGTNLTQASHIMYVSLCVPVSLGVLQPSFALCCPALCAACSLVDPVAGSKEEARAVESQAIGRAHRQGQTKKVVRVLQPLSPLVRFGVSRSLCVGCRWWCASSVKTQSKQRSTNAISNKQLIPPLPPGLLHRSSKELFPPLPIRLITSSIPFVIRFKSAQHSTSQHSTAQHVSVLPHFLSVCSKASSNCYLCCPRTLCCRRLSHLSAHSFSADRRCCVVLRVSEEHCTPPPPQPTTANV